MKIGIVSSGVESLILFKILNKYDCEYIVYFDSLMASYGDKYFWTSLAAVKKGVETLKKQRAEMIIVPPVYELALLKEGENQILPLFREYLFEFVRNFLWLKSWFQILLLNMSYSQLNLRQRNFIFHLYFGVKSLVSQRGFYRNFLGSRIWQIPS